METCITDAQTARKDTIAKRSLELFADRAKCTILQTLFAETPI